MALAELDVPGGDPERDPGDDLIGRRVDPKQAAPLGTGAGSRAIDGPQGAAAHGQGTADVGDPRNDLVRSGIDPDEEGTEIVAGELCGGAPDASLARGELLDVADERDPRHHLVRDRVDPDNDVVLRGLLGRHAYPDGPLADGHILRIRADGDDGGYTRLQLDGFTGRPPVGPIDGSGSKPQPQAGEAGGRERERQRDRRDPGGAPLLLWSLVDRLRIDAGVFLTRRPTETVFEPHVRTSSPARRRDAPSAKAPARVVATSAARARTLHGAPACHVASNGPEAAASSRDATAASVCPSRATTMCP